MKKYIFLTILAIFTIAACHDIIDMDSNLKKTDLTEKRKDTININTDNIDFGTMRLGQSERMTFKLNPQISAQDTFITIKEFYWQCNLKCNVQLIEKLPFTTTEALGYYITIQVTPLESGDGLVSLRFLTDQGEIIRGITYKAN